MKKYEYMNKSNALLLFVASVGLIVVAILFTSIIAKTRDTTVRQDTRAKASAQSMTVFYGKVHSYESTTGTLIVDNLMFDDSNGKPLGTWNVHVPSNFDASKFPAGSEIRIGANPETFNITENTLTAKEIAKK